jgi:hypothetical protein
MVTKTKKHLFVLIVLSICMTHSELFAQSNSSEDIVTAPNSIFGEFFGQGIFLSANYDRLLFDKTPHNIALRAGLGFWANLRIGGNEESGVTIPLNISYLFGGNHKFELGLGYTLAPDISLQLGKGTITSPGTLTTIIGYRYQPIDGGFLFRIGVVYYLTAEEATTIMVGLSFGYAF